MKPVSLKITNVTKIFTKGNESNTAVDTMNLEVAPGEMIAFLGPSGCGKTTTLRMVAGFEIPTSGQITVNGTDITNTPVNKRGIGFVFQNYALFPHMTVFENIGYGLKAKHMDPEEITKKVKASLETVGLPGIENRYPNQLSGGEQQRVALARVIVMEPSLLLMDEPLSNLDAKLRIHMRSEIRHLQKKLGITCLYVTHDQSEALTVADKIVVMSKGKIEQIGTPTGIYQNPHSAFVADFIGQANILSAKVVSDVDGKITAEFLPGKNFTAKKGEEVLQKKAGDMVNLIIRPENIQVEDYNGGAVEAMVTTAIFSGSHTEYELTLQNGQKIKASVDYKTGTKIHEEGSKVNVVFDQISALYNDR